MCIPSFTFCTEKRHSNSLCLTFHYDIFMVRRVSAPNLKKKGELTFRSMYSSTYLNTISKSINQLDYTSYLTCRIFANFDLDPESKWQNNLEFRNCISHFIHAKRCRPSKRYRQLSQNFPLRKSRTRDKTLTQTYTNQIFVDKVSF